MSTSVTLNQKDMDLLTAIWKTAKTPIQIDYQALADAGFYKNANSARASLDGFMKRIFGANWKTTSTSGGGGGGEGSSAANTPKRKKLPIAPSLRKAAQTASADGETTPGSAATDEDEDEVEVNTPQKKKAKKEETPESEKAGEDGEEDHKIEM